jgi:hypothetical protein
VGLRPRTVADLHKQRTPSLPPITMGGASSSTASSCPLNLCFFISSLLNLISTHMHSFAALFSISLTHTILRNFTFHPETCPCVNRSAPVRQCQRQCVSVSVCDYAKLEVCLRTSVSVFQGVDVSVCRCAVAPNPRSAGRGQK